MTVADETLLARFNGSPGADPVAISAFESASGISLPVEYKKFLLRTNGGEGFAGNSYLILWRIEELKEANDACEVARCVPGLLFFGSDGGGEAMAFDCRNSSMAVVSVPFIGMEFDVARSISPDFDGFLAAMACADYS